MAALSALQDLSELHLEGFSWLNEALLELSAALSALSNLRSLMRLLQMLLTDPPVCIPSSLSEWWTRLMTECCCMPAESDCRYVSDAHPHRRACRTATWRKHQLLAQYHGCGS